MLAAPADQGGIVVGPVEGGFGAITADSVRGLDDVIPVPARGPDLEDLHHGFVDVQGDRDRFNVVGFPVQEEGEPRGALTGTELLLGRRRHSSPPLLRPPSLPDPQPGIRNLPPIRRRQGSVDQVELQLLDPLSLGPQRRLSED